VKRITAMTGGVSALPLLILVGLNFVDEFDRVAFAALTPEIRDAFHLSDTGIQAVALVSGIFVLLAALPLGILSDRFNRVRIAVIAAVLWGVCSVFTGIVPVLGLLIAVRLGSGLGRIINEVVHPSLLQDYYPAESHPRVFGLHRAANAVGAIAGPVAGVIAAAFNWQAAFFLLAIPTGFFLAAAVRLREPLRGESIDAELAADAAEEGAVPFGEARRQLFNVATLRRLWVGAFFLGIGAIPLAEVLSLFFEKVYRYGPEGRGVIQFLLGAGEVVGLIIGARLAGQAAEHRNLGRLAVITGLSFIAFALGLVLMAASPWSVVSAALVFVLSIGYGGWQPAYFSLVGQVAPPRVRSQAYAWAILIYGTGGIAYLVLAGIGENGSYRTLSIVLAAIVALAGLIGASARRFVTRDVAQAAATLSAAVEVREAMKAVDGARPLLVCRGVEVAYGPVQILFGVDAEVMEGEIVALLGTNGAGKSTLLKAISGLVDPMGGAIFFDGRDITHADAVQTSRLGIVQVPGGKAVFPTLTVAEHFKSGTWLFRDEDPAAVEARIQYVLEKFPRLQERWDQMAGNLSGGEQQQLAVGMAFVAKPRLLIIDELSLGLAPTIVEQLLNMVREIHAAGCTIILVEQSVNVALTIASKAYFMEKGEVRFHGPTAELLERGDILRAVFLKGSNETRAAQSRAKVPPAVAKRAAELRETPLADRPVLLSVSGLTKRFGGIRAVDDVTFDVREGEILGLIGPNGAGKTTIFDLISGHLPLDGGRLVLNGVDITEMGAHRRAALGLGRSFQDARIFPAMTVAENVAMGLERHIEVRDHLSSLLDLPAAQASEDDVAWTVDDLIELMNLGAFRNKFVGELSTGSRRIVDLAMAIAHDPNVLLLDEPSSGIAQKETEALGPLLLRIRDTTGASLLVIEHDMPLITSISDRMIALDLGRVITSGPPDEVINHPAVVASYLGDSDVAVARSGPRTS
jgi:branched-chain amino acid transport system ATP-binding protein